MVPLLVGLGAMGGFFSGLLGLGGAILMIPLLLLVPPLLGLPALSMKTVAAISTMQVAAASLSAVLTHRKRNVVSRPLVLWMGTAGAAFSLVGGYVSRYVTSSSLLAIFAVLSTLASLLMFIPRHEIDSPPDADRVPFRRDLALLVAALVGGLGGMVGAPGAFLYVPIMIYVLGVPTRVTLGSSLAIVLLNALFALVGKIASGQMPWALALALVAGAVPAARLGSVASYRVPVARLRLLVAIVVIASTLRLWLEVPGVRLVLSQF